MKTTESDTTDRALPAARVLWGYLRLGDRQQASDGPADAIVVLGSSDLRSAGWGARLWIQRRAPLLILSGGRGRLTTDWPEPEAELFAREAERLGVPRDRMLLEPRSSNTGENVRFTRELATDRGLRIERCLAVHTPYMERRTRATFRRFWPEPETATSSLAVSLEEYPAGDISLDDLIHRLAGEVHRMLEYPSRGWQAPDEVPPDVVAAWRELVALGYDGCAVP